MNTIWIGFGHKARMGKDTAVKAIVDAYRDKYDVRRYGFGDELRRETRDLDIFELCMRNGIEFDPNAPADPEYHPKYGKQRRFLQWYGTSYRRAQDPFYWVTKLRKRVEEEKPQFALISDMRFLNEYFLIKAFGGFTVKVTRHGFVNLSESAKHVSETQLDGAQFDFEINCLDGEVDQLRSDACTVFDMICEQLNTPFVMYEE